MYDGPHPVVEQFHSIFAQVGVPSGSVLEKEEEKGTLSFPIIYPTGSDLKTLCFFFFAIILLFILSIHACIFMWDLFARSTRSIVFDGDIIREFFVRRSFSVSFLSTLALPTTTTILIYPGLISAFASFSFVPHRIHSRPISTVTPEANNRFLL